MGLHGTTCCTTTDRAGRAPHTLVMRTKAHSAEIVLFVFANLGTSLMCRLIQSEHSSVQAAEFREGAYFGGFLDVVKLVFCSFDSRVYGFGGWV